MSNLQTYYHFKLDFQKVDQHTEGKWLIHGTNVARTISCKAWISPAEYPSGECKHYIKESEGNMFNPVFKENVQEWRHPGSCADDNYDIIWIIPTQHMCESQKIYQYKHIISLINAMCSIIINSNFLNCTNCQMLCMMEVRLSGCSLPSGSGPYGSGTTSLNKGLQTWQICLF